MNGILFSQKTQQVLTWCAAATLLGAFEAAGFPTENENSPGTMALNYRRSSNVWFRSDAAIVDASVRTTPPDSKTIERRLESLYILGGDQVITPRFGVRLNLQLEVSKRRQGEENPPVRYVDTTQVVGAPTLDLTFITAAGLEIFGGAMVQGTPKIKQTVESDFATSQTLYKSSVLVVPHVGVVRRSAAWSGGFYYIDGREAKRALETTASDGSVLSTEDVVQVPTQMGIFGEFSTKMLEFDFELAAVQAGQGGNRSELGDSVREDYLLARTDAYWGISPAFGLKFGAMHQTLSYASNSFMSLDTIPVTSVRSLLMIGGPRSNAFIGAIYGFGRDGQSIPEYNATYDLKAYAITAGAFLPFGSIR